MSWKMFWQIALLIVITAIVMTTMKYALYCTGGKGSWKCMKKGMHGMQHKGMKGIQERPSR